MESAPSGSAGISGSAAKTGDATKLTSVTARKSKAGIDYSSEETRSLS
jgi:hypothetical protein